ncbi:Uncharacterised protein [Mycobacteroides abscessus subsp. abscessus]|nr:Uncharacterised protein [Mycobacteroides abscessus subsp. abscessus]
MHLPTTGVIDEALEFHPIGHELSGRQADALVQLLSVFTTEWLDNLMLVYYCCYVTH